MSRSWTYGLHQDVVLAEEQCGSGVLVERLHVIPRPHQRPVVHTAARLSLLDLRRNTDRTTDADLIGRTWENTGEHLVT